MTNWFGFPLNYFIILFHLFHNLISCVGFALISDSSDSGSTKVRERRSGLSGGGSGGHGGRTKGSSDGKPTRVRTVLNEKQLHTLRTCYNANPRPDALMKEQLVEMTSLSPRVIRVWFQNKRCKDKKKTIAIKQQMQQEKVNFFNTKLQSPIYYIGTDEMAKPAVKNLARKVKLLFFLTHQKAATFFLSRGK